MAFAAPTVFPLRRRVLRCWMWPSSVWTASEIPAPGYTALHLLASYKSKAFATPLGFLWVAARKREGKEERKKKKSLWGFVLGCSGAEGTAAASTQQREWKATAQRWPQLCCFPLLLHDTLCRSRSIVSHSQTSAINDNTSAWLFMWTGLAHHFFFFSLSTDLEEHTTSVFIHFQQD